MSGRIARRAGSDHGDAQVSRGPLPELLGYHLRRAQTAMFKDFGAVVGDEEDITPGLFGMLQVIAANPGMSQSRLAEAMGVDRSTIVSVVDALEARGLVKRAPSLQDGRSHLLRFTGKGKQALRRMEKLVLRHEASFASVLSGAERETLIGLLARLYERRRGRAPKAGGPTRRARRKP